MVNSEPREFLARYEAVMEEYLSAVASASVEFEQAMKDSMAQIGKLAAAVEEGKAPEGAGSSQGASDPHDSHEPRPTGGARGCGRGPSVFNP